MPMIELRASPPPAIRRHRRDRRNAWILSMVIAGLVLMIAAIARA